MTCMDIPGIQINKNSKLNEQLIDTGDYLIWSHYKK